jgi:hypothetical protein
MLKRARLLEWEPGECTAERHGSRVADCTCPTGAAALGLTDEQAARLVEDLRKTLDKRPE